MLRKKFIKDPIFGGNFWFCIGSKDEFADFVYKKDGYEVNRDVEVDGKMVKIIGGRQFIWIQNKDISVLIHEIVHMVNNNMDRVAIPLSVDTDEVYAFYTQFLFKECNKFLNEKPKLQKTIRKNLGEKKTRR